MSAALLMESSRIMGVHSNGDPYKEPIDATFEKNVISAMEVIKTETGKYPQIYATYPSFNTVLAELSGGESAELFFKNLELYFDYAFHNGMNQTKAFSRTEYDMSGQIEGVIRDAVRFMFIARILAHRGVEIKNHNRKAFQVARAMEASEAAEYLSLQYQLAEDYSKVLNIEPLDDKMRDTHKLTYAKSELKTHLVTVVRTYKKYKDFGINFDTLNHFIALRISSRLNSSFGPEHVSDFVSKVDDLTNGLGWPSVSMYQMANYIREGFFDLDYIRQWMDNGFLTAVDASKWYSMGYEHPDEAKAMREATPSDWAGAW